MGCLHYVIVIGVKIVGVIVSSLLTSVMWQGGCTVAAARCYVAGAGARA